MALVVLLLLLLMLCCGTVFAASTAAADTTASSEPTPTPPGPAQVTFAWDYDELGEATGWWAYRYPTCSATSSTTTTTTEQHVDTDTDTTTDTTTTAVRDPTSVTTRQQSPIDIPTARVVNTTITVVLRSYDGKPFGNLVATIATMSAYNVIHGALLLDRFRVYVEWHDDAGALVMATPALYAIHSFALRYPAEHHIDGHVADVEVQSMMTKVADGVYYARTDTARRTPLPDPLEPYISVDSLFATVPDGHGVPLIEATLAQVLFDVDMGSTEVGFVVSTTPLMYTYVGTMTSPPCTAAVRHLVTQQPLPLQHSTLMTLRSLSVPGMGARRVQPLLDGSTNDNTNNNNNVDGLAQHDDDAAATTTTTTTTSSSTVIQRVQVQVKDIITDLPTTPGPAHYHIVPGEEDYSGTTHKYAVAAVACVDALLLCALLWLCWERYSYRYPYNHTWRVPTTRREVFGVPVRYGSETGRAKALLTLPSEVASRPGNGGSSGEAEATTTTAAATTAAATTTSPSVTPTTPPLGDDAAQGAPTIRALTMTTTTTTSAATAVYKPTPITRFVVAVSCAGSHQGNTPQQHATTTTAAAAVGAHSLSASVSQQQRQTQQWLTSNTLVLPSPQLAVGGGGAAPATATAATPAMYMSTSAPTSAAAAAAARAAVLASSVASNGSFAFRPHSVGHVVHNPSLDALRATRFLAIDDNDNAAAATTTTTTTTTATTAATGNAPSAAAAVAATSPLPMATSANATTATAAAAAAAAAANVVATWRLGASFAVSSALDDVVLMNAGGNNNSSGSGSGDDKGDVDAAVYRVHLLLRERDDNNGDDDDARPRRGDAATTRGDATTSTSSSPPPSPSQQPAQQRHQVMQVTATWRQFLQLARFVQSVAPQFAPAAAARLLAVARRVWRSSRRPCHRRGGDADENDDEKDDDDDEEAACAANLAADDDLRACLLANAVSYVESSAAAARRDVCDGGGGGAATAAAPLASSVATNASSNSNSRSQPQRSHAAVAPLTWAGGGDDASAAALTSSFALRGSATAAAAAAAAQQQQKQRRVLARCAYMEAYLNACIASTAVNCLHELHAFVGYTRFVQRERVHHAYAAAQQQQQQQQQQRRQQQQQPTQQRDARARRGTDAMVAAPAVVAASPPLPQGYLSDDNATSSSSGGGGEDGGKARRAARATASARPRRHHRRRRRRARRRHSSSSSSEEDSEGGDGGGDEAAALLRECFALLDDTGAGALSGDDVLLGAACATPASFAALVDAVHADAALAPRPLLPFVAAVPRALLERVVPSSLRGVCARCAAGGADAASFAAFARAVLRRCGGGGGAASSRGVLARWVGRVRQLRVVRLYGAVAELVGGDVAAAWRAGLRRLSRVAAATPGGDDDAVARLVCGESSASSLRCVGDVAVGELLCLVYVVACAGVRVVGVGEVWQWVARGAWWRDAAFAADEWAAALDALGRVVPLPLLLRAVRGGGRGDGCGAVLRLVARYAVGADEAAVAALRASVQARRRAPCRDAAVMTTRRGGADDEDDGAGDAAALLRARLRVAERRVAALSRALSACRARPRAAAVDPASATAAKTSARGQAASGPRGASPRRRRSVAALLASWRRPLWAPGGAAWRAAPLLPSTAAASDGDDADALVAAMRVTSAGALLYAVPRAGGTPLAALCFDVFVCGNGGAAAREYVAMRGNGGGSGGGRVSALLLDDVRLYALWRCRCACHAGCGGNSNAPSRGEAASTPSRRSSDSLLYPSPAPLSRRGAAPASAAAARGGVCARCAGGCGRVCVAALPVRVWCRVGVAFDWQARHVTLHVAVVDGAAAAVASSLAPPRAVAMYDDDGDDVALVDVYPRLTPRVCYCNTVAFYA